MLLTHHDISQFQMDPRAIEKVPESVAREWLVLPVRWHEGTLHVLLPTESELGLENTIARLKFVLECPFTYQLAVTEALRPFVDLYYSAVYSEITNCAHSLKFRCPKRWAELNPTDDVRVRFCEVCNLSVTFCTNREELTQLSAEGKCVAFYDGSEHWEFVGLSDTS